MSSRLGFALVKIRHNFLCILLQVAPEPVAQWQNIGIDKFNLLEEFYQNKERFAYTFQNYVFITRLLQVRKLNYGISQWSYCQL